jgi:hypothetical protein
MTFSELKRFFARIEDVYFFIGDASLSVLESFSTAPGNSRLPSMSVNGSERPFLNPEMLAASGDKDEGGDTLNWEEFDDGVSLEGRPLSDVVDMST